MTLETQPMSISSEQAPVHFNWPRRLLIPLSFLAWGFLIFLTFVLAGRVVETLILLGVAVLIAYALLPIANRLDAHMPRWLAIAITYVVFGGAHRWPESFKRSSKSSGWSIAASIPSCSPIWR